MRWLILANHTFLHSGDAFLAVDGLTSGSGAMVMIAVVTSLAMRFRIHAWWRSTLSMGRWRRCRWAALLFGDYP